MRINHNIMAINAHRSLTGNNNMVGKSLEKLSSGLRINRAGDDAAGLAISEKMRAQIRGLEMAQKNALDGISLIQTAEGALTEVHAMLGRMRELAIQSGNDTNTDSSQPGVNIGDRDMMQDEIDHLIAEIDRIALDTQFNTKTLLNGSNPDLVFHIGPNKDQRVTVNLPILDAGALLPNGVNVILRDEANNSIEYIDDAINVVSKARADLGAIQNRLEHTINNLGVAHENLSAAESRIRDVDMAKEMMEFTKNSILTQSAQAMLAQANQVPQGILQLLR